MRLTSHVLRIWADDHHIPDLALAELDYRLTQTLDAIYGDPFLRERLYLKGGTALNKLFLPAANRLSVDLDFNAVGPKAQVLAERTQLANQIITLLAGQDAGYALAHDYRRYEQSTIRADFAPVSGGPRQHLRLEISFIERVPILGREERLLASPDGAKTTLISTYRVEELTATKLRALYGRRKGRDIYDLAQIGAFDLDERTLRKLTLYYFYHSKMIFHYPAFRANVEEKLRRRGFADDVRGLIRTDQQFDWQQACQAVLDRYAFLAELDERDRGFLRLARHLLGAPVSEHEAETLAQIEHPIAWLMEGSPITTEAAALRQDDIRLFMGA
jgi:predicted nucleotidyltransferase component of viral defense system